jgi:hypothetical protein
MRLLGRIKSLKPKQAKKPHHEKIKIKPGKDQPDFFSGAADPKDLLAPSLIKEVKPGEKIMRG